MDRYRDDPPAVMAKVKRCKRETNEAILVEDYEGSLIWIPKVVLHPESEIRDACERATGKLVVRRGWAEDMGF